MKYSLVIHTSEGTIFSSLLRDEGMVTCFPFSLRIKRTQKEKYELFEITVSSRMKQEIYLSLMGEGKADFYSFNGICKKERIFRQSPHDPQNYHFKMEKSAIPMVAAVENGKAAIWISDNPSYFDNATTQHIVPEGNRFYLSSGDKGGTPNNPESEPFAPIFHTVGGEKTHTFRFIAFHADVDELKGIRREAFLAIEKVWGKGSDSHYRALCFASNYMHIRKNETGSSEKWIVAGIEYANTQYFRDAFYQSMILDEKMQNESYLALNFECKEAENPLIYLIWSYRIVKHGKNFDRARTDRAFETVLACMNKFEPNDSYYPNGKENGDFRCWFDTCAFDRDDVDLYNQGLLVCALEAAKRLGYDIGDRKERALAKYHALFNGNYFPLSQKKQCLALDFTVGEVLYYLLFEELFIDQTMFEKSYRKVCDSAAKTKYGIKIVAAEDGSYISTDIFKSGDYLYAGFKTMDTGRYQNGGSWHLYEMLFHIAAYLHGMPDAEKNLTERLLIDLDYDGATHEYMHTITGTGVKANQGWNAAVYAIWEELIRRGKATDAFFRAADAKIASLSSKK
ncbi:MAG: hypothetical protein J6K63_06915 [Clostridia bacterium]|nr:hypothetical protein [Clostridia bacterium]